MGLGPGRNEVKDGLRGSWAAPGAGWSRVREASNSQQNRAGKAGGGESGPGSFGKQKAHTEQVEFLSGPPRAAAGPPTSHSLT